MNETSKKVVQLVHKYNATLPSAGAAYTFDAGPNPVIYLLKDHVTPVLSMILKNFPTDVEENFLRNVSNEDAVRAHQVPEHLTVGNSEENRNGLKYIFQTSVGPGPQVQIRTSNFGGKDANGPEVISDKGLLCSGDGLPVKLASL